MREWVLHYPFWWDRRSSGTCVNQTFAVVMLNSIYEEPGTQTVEEQYYWMIDALYDKSRALLRPRCRSCWPDGVSPSS